jgi:prolipoprotein diacylglyceryltransferase
MFVNEKYIISILLVLSFGFMIALLSGGHINVSNVSQREYFILQVLYTFITFLTLISILLVLFIFEDRWWAFVASTACGISYLLIYALDLSRIYPSSVKNMSQYTQQIETLGLLVSIPLILFSVSALIKYKIVKSN